jgi:hypothetical protein
MESWYHFWNIHCFLFDMKDIVYNNENLPQKQLTTFSEKLADAVIDGETYKYSSGSARLETAPKGTEKSSPVPDKLDDLLTRCVTFLFYLHSILSFFFPSPFLFSYYFFKFGATQGMPAT